MLSAERSLPASLRDRLLALVDPRFLSCSAVGLVKLSFALAVVSGGAGFAGYYYTMCNSSGV